MRGVKTLRWSHVVSHHTGHGLIVPIDHGLTSGSMAGLESSATPARWLSHPAITAVIAHKGMLERLTRTGGLLGKGVILQMNGMMSSAAEPNRKEALASIESALMLGADALSLDLVFDGAQDSQNLSLLSRVTDEASRYGLPVLVMAKCLGPEGKIDPSIARTRHVVRALWEVGADAVKLQKPAFIDDIPALLENLVDDIDVFFAGGPRSTDAEIAELLACGLAAGAHGLCVGRNVFQNTHPEKFLTSLGLVVARHADKRMTLVGAH